jgi:hypothetical protein
VPSELLRKCYAHMARWSFLLPSPTRTLASPKGADDIAERPPEDREDARDEDRIGEGSYTYAMLSRGSASGEPNERDHLDRVQERGSALAWKSAPEARLAWADGSRRCSLTTCEPSAAALMTYRADGSADVSPVWFRHIDSTFEIVIAEDDPKMRTSEPMG